MTADADVLAGGGEMGALMRATNWAATPLGPVSGWPQSLRTAVSILLDSRFGMYIAWGPQYVQLYNDGYRPILGSTKHPHALGNVTSHTFAESWDIIGPMFAGVREGKATGADDWMLPLDRHGYLEECFFTYSYSPIRDEKNEVGGVHVTVTETTHRVLAERRLRTVHDVAALVVSGATGDICAAVAAALGAAAEDVPFALFYLLSEDGRCAQLQGAVGVSVGDRAAPSEVPLDERADHAEGAEPSWPIARVLRTREVAVVDDVAARFGPVASRAWPENVEAAVVVPIMRAGTTAPYGVLVAGVSPRRALDAPYEELFVSIASHVGAALSETRRLAEERDAVERERDRLYAHFQQAPFAVSVVRGNDFVVEMANPAALAVWGKTETIIGKPLLEGFPELRGQPFVGYLEGVLRTGVAYEGKGALARLPRGPGGALTDIYFNFVYSPLRARSGEVEGVLVAGFEVTAEALARREAEDAHGLFRSLVDNVPELAWAARPDGYIDFYNGRWYEYTGTTPADMEGWGWKSVHDPLVLESVMERWTASLATGNPFEMEFPLRGADGVFRWFLTRVRPLRDADGKIVRWFGVNTNIDERVQLLASEKAAREEAERSSRAKDEFIAIVSHELRNPLNAMLGWTRLLRAGSLPQDRHQRALETIERNAVTQAQLIEDMLDVARIVSGKLKLEVESVPLARVIEAALDSARPAIDAKGLRLTAVLDTEGVLTGDPGRLQQVVWNLVTNATKFTPRGGAIRVSLSRDDSHLELVVSDSGQGIDVGFLPHVFERFRQADPSTTRQQGGLGLGLAITKNLVEMHGGTIAVHSEGSAKGATFIVRLPVAAVRQSATITTPTPRAAPSPSAKMDMPPELRGLRVLAIDDEPDGREMVAAVLATCGATVVSASSVAEAIAAMERELPDVIVSDIGMPDEDGYAFIRRVRALPRERGGATPAACLTGYASVDDRRRSLLAGFNIHLVKPVDPSELVAVVASLARMAAALRMA